MQRWIGSDRKTACNRSVKWPSVRLTNALCLYDDSCARQEQAGRENLSRLVPSGTLLILQLWMPGLGGRAIVRLAQVLCELLARTQTASEYRSRRPATPIG